MPEILGFGDSTYLEINEIDLSGLTIGADVSYKYNSTVGINVTLNPGIEVTNNLYLNTKVEAIAVAKPGINIIATSSLITGTELSFTVNAITRILLNTNVKLGIIVK